MEEFYKKKIIRDFLSQFSESKWKPLTILCIEYGILHLKKSYSVSSLSLEDIEGIVDELREDDKKAQTKNLKQKFTKGDVKSNSSASAKNANDPGRPSSNWRKGDLKTIFDEPNVPKDRGGNMNDVSSLSKASKEKRIDEILFPKQERIVKYYKDNVTIGNDTRKPRKTRSSSTSNRNLTHSSSFSGKNQSFQAQSQRKFNSGLQKLQMKQNETPNQTTQYYASYTTHNNHMPNTKSLVSFPNQKFSNVQSRIKSQVKTDKKIYEMLKHKQTDDNTFGEERESIIEKQSDLSFDEDLSSRVYK